MTFEQENRLIMAACMAIVILLVGCGIAFAETGVASWYGGKHHGRRTASGEIYNMNAMTCAHRTARFGTILHVSTGRRSIDCRVNDRGPFVRGRIVDLSRAGARQLGCNGVCRVTISRSLRTGR